MNESAKRIGEIAGLGLAAHYAKNVADGHPRHPEMEGGLTPRLAPTGDAKHDMAMAGGRFATNLGISWLILLPIWKVYAAATGVGLYLLGNHLHIHVLWLGAVLWCLLQILYFWACGRIFDGKRARDPKGKKIKVPRTRTGWVQTQVIDGKVVFVEAPNPNNLNITVNVAAPRVRPHIPAHVRRQVLARDGYQCQECGATDDLEIDHIIAVTKGGSTTPENLEVLCHTCNCRKGNRP